MDDVIETLDGYVIRGPGHPVDACFHTFGRTASEAWTRHIGHERPDRATLINRWTQKGWRLVPARLVLAPANTGGGQ